MLLPTTTLAFLTPCIFVVSSLRSLQIDELKSEYKEALGILRDVVQRMQSTDEDEAVGDLSPMIKRRFGEDMEEAKVKQVRGCACTQNRRNKVSSFVRF